MCQNGPWRPASCCCIARVGEAEAEVAAPRVDPEGSGLGTFTAGAVQVADQRHKSSELLRRWRRCQGANLGVPTGAMGISVPTQWSTGGNKRSCRIPRRSTDSALVSSASSCVSSRCAQHGGPAHIQAGTIQTVAIVNATRSLTNRDKCNEDIRDVARPRQIFT